MLPKVYALVKGASLDDEARVSLRQELISTLTRHGVVYQRDADAGLLPGSEDRTIREGVVNSFTVGRLKYPERFNIQDMEDVMAELVGFREDMNRARLTYVVLVAASPLHRHIHRDHDCMPSSVLAQFDDKVLAESCLVDRDTLGIAVQNNEPRGMLFILDRPEPAPPGFVPIRAWEADPVVAAIPDGSAGVGGRTLLKTFALERTGYHGGDIPDNIKAVSPDKLGFVEERSPDSLPMLVMADRVKVISAVGGHGNSSLVVNLTLMNNTDGEIVVDVPAGSLFEVIDPKAAVQNLATAGGMSIRMGPRSTRSVVINAFCANHHFASPSNQPMRPTVFKMKNPGRSQGEVWSDLDRRGY